MSTASNHQQPKSIWPIFVIGLLMIALFWIGSQALLNLPEPAEQEDAARSLERAQAYEELQAADQERLSSFAVLDETSVQVPIDLAMRMAEGRLNAKELSPAGLVNPPPPDMPAPAEEVAAEEESADPVDQEETIPEEQSSEPTTQPANGGGEP